MLANLGLPTSFCADKQNLNGACVAFDPMNAKARGLAEEWALLAREQNIIAPPGSSRENHRQDQALLSVLAYRSGIVGDRLPHTRGFSIHWDLPEAT